MKKRIILFGLIVGCGLASCKKEGCTDENAKNYNEEAKKDDGTCNYEAKFTTWFNVTSAQAMVSDGVSELTFFLDDKIIGSLEPADFADEIPQCSGPEGLFTIVDLGKMSETDAVEYSCKDNFGNIVKSAIFPKLVAGDCNKYQLFY